MAKMIAPEGMTSAGWQGKEFKVGRDRLVTVPDEAVQALRAHGLVPQRQMDDEKA